MFERLSAASWHLPWMTLPLVLTMSILSPCSSFMLHHNIKVTIVSTALQVENLSASPSHMCQSTPISLASTDRDGIGSRQVEPYHEDSYLDFHHTQDAIDNADSKLSTDVERKIKSAAEAATSRLSSATTRGTAYVKHVGKRIKSEASATAHRLSNVANKGSADVLSYAGNAIIDAKNIAESSTERIREKSVLVMELATTKYRDVFDFTEKGIIEIQSFSKNGTEKFGEVANWINRQTESGTEIVGSKAKSLVLGFTGKNEYSFGDITYELIRRISAKEIAVQDAILVIKILVAFGASIGPLAKALPLTILLEALNSSLEQKIGTQVLDALALSIDNRILAAFSSDDKVQIGDAVKRTVLTGVLAFTGKSSYESGDIRRVVQKNEVDGSHKPARLDLMVDPELQEWDRLFIERCLRNVASDNDLSSSAAKALDMKISLALEECARLDEHKSKDLGQGTAVAQWKHLDKLN